jgi:hypothetical protein
MDVTLHKEEIMLIVGKNMWNPSFIPGHAHAIMQIFKE